MEKIALDVLHEVELYSNSDLEDFTAQLFLITKDKMQFAFDLARVKKNESIFTFKIPKSLQIFLKEPVKYKVYVYLDNARFLADDGDLQVVSQDHFKGGKIVNPAQDVKFSAKIKGEETEEKIEKQKTPEKKPQEAKKETKKEEPVKETVKIDIPKTEPIPKRKKENINLDEIFEQQRKIRESLNEDGTRKKSSLRDYTERMERNKKLAENKDELNEKVKNILSSFNSK